MAEELNGKKVMNDIVDEVYELEDGEDVLDEREIRNQLIDGEVNVSDDSENYIATPREDASSYKTYSANEENQSISDKSNDQFRKTKISGKFVNQHEDELKNLNLNPEVYEIFKYIDNYEPETSEPAVSLKPFIPDYIPAVGEVDGFLKIPRADGKDEELGSHQIDEPALNMSKKSYLDLMIREFFKGKIREDKREIHTVSNAHKNSKLVQRWITDVAEVHKQRIPPSVFYSKKMPEIDNLMQSWDSEMEKKVKNIEITSHDLSFTTSELSQLVCNIADIPVYDLDNNKNQIESLHVLFTLFSAFKENDHFNEQNEENQFNKNSIKTSQN